MYMYVQNLPNCFLDLMGSFLLMGVCSWVVTLVGCHRVLSSTGADHHSYTSPIESMLYYGCITSGEEPLTCNMLNLAQLLKMHYTVVGLLVET